MNIKTLFFISLLSVFSLNLFSAANNYFFKNPVEEIKQLSSPRVISIGCGLVARAEMNQLQKIFGGNFDYVCLEVDKAKADSYKGSDITVHNIDASDLSALKKAGIRQNNFDLAVVRHPDFFSHAPAFRTIFRRVIPHILKKNGFLFVSLVHEDETIFIARESKSHPHRSRDHQIFELNYELLDFQRSSHTDDDLIKKMPDAGRDKFQYYFRNRVNRSVEPKGSYRIPEINDCSVLLAYADEIEAEVNCDAQPVPLVQLFKEHKNIFEEIFQLTFAQVCHNPSCLKDDKSLSKSFPNCARCKRVHYCSKSCQTLDWSAHKKECTLLTQ